MMKITDIKEVLQNADDEYVIITFQGLSGEDIIREGTLKIEENNEYILYGPYPWVECDYHTAFTDKDFHRITEIKVNPDLPPTLLDKVDASRLRKKMHKKLRKYTEVNDFGDHMIRVVNAEELIMNLIKKFTI